MCLPSLFIKGIFIAPTVSRSALHMVHLHQSLPSWSLQFKLICIHTHTYLGALTYQHVYGVWEETKPMQAQGEHANSTETSAWEMYQGPQGRSANH